MPPVSFPFEIRIDGQSYRCRRLDGTRSYAATFIPQVAGQRASVQLDPLNTADWGDGRGWGQNNDTSEGMVMPGPDVTSISLPSAPGADLEQFAEQDGHIYAVGGRYAFRIDSGSGPVTVDQDLGASFVAVSVVPFKNTLVVGGRTSGNVWQKTAGGAWSNTMVSGAVQRGKLTTVWWNTGGGNALRLVGEGAPTTLTYVAANPLLSTDWSTAITIGSYPIRSMVASRFHAYVGTTGGLFDFDQDGTAANLTPDIEKVVMDTNGGATLAMNGWVYINGGYTLYRVRAVGQEYAQVQECGWSAQLPRQCPMAGYITAITKYGRWLWAAIYDGTSTWLCKAREATANDRYGPLVWFVAPIYLAGVKVTALHTSGLVSLNPRLWIGCNAGGTRSLKWAHLPLDSAYRDLRQARLYRFSISAQYDEPEEDHGDDTYPVYVREIVAETENTSGSTQDSLSIAKDGEATFSIFGVVRTNPRAIVKSPASTVFLPNRYILRHTLAGTTATPPIIRKRSTRVIPRPDLLEVRAYQVICGMAVHSSDGALDGRTVKSARTMLSALQSGGPRLMDDEDRTSITAMIAAGENLTEVEARLGDGQDRRVLVADLQVAVLRIAGGVTFHLNDGTRLNDPTRVLA